MEKLKITMIQSGILWKDIDGNLKNFGNKINGINETTDIVVLPEMFTTGFVMEPEKYAEKMDGKAVNWMKETAKINNVMLIGSMIIEEDLKFTNRLIVAYPNGETDYYDKRHLFSLAGENRFFTSGNKRLIIDYKSWKINTLICYDLRFPVWSRNQDDYDVLIYVANWPASRSFHWKILLQARAIENQSYIIGVNRIGNDGNNTPHSGDSCAFDPYGKNMCNINPNQEIIETIVLEKEYLNNIRKSFPFHTDKDKFALC